MNLKSKVLITISIKLKTLSWKLDSPLSIIFLSRAIFILWVAILSFQSIFGFCDYFWFSVYFVTQLVFFALLEKTHTFNRFFTYCLRISERQNQINSYRDSKRSVRGPILVREKVQLSKIKIWTQIWHSNQ